MLCFNCFFCDTQNQSAPDAHVSGLGYDNWQRAGVRRVCSIRNDEPWEKVSHLRTHILNYFSSLYLQPQHPPNINVHGFDHIAGVWMHFRCGCYIRNAGPGQKVSLSARIIQLTQTYAVSPILQLDFFICSPFSLSLSYELAIAQMTYSTHNWFLESNF